MNATTSFTLPRSCTAASRSTVPVVSEITMGDAVRDIEDIRGHIHPLLQPQVLHQATRSSKGRPNPVHLIQGGDVNHEEFQGILQGHNRVWLLARSDKEHKPDKLTSSRSSPKRPLSSCTRASPSTWHTSFCRAAISLPMALALSWHTSAQLSTPCNAIRASPTCQTQENIMNKKSRKHQERYKKSSGQHKTVPFQNKQIFPPISSSKPP
ncbi:hypothetical protein E2C01_007091 [Portunus trituberculatus]|uniref:Uncharacterized protein n=1 Tax=Portunus trituberculatus TaxID=210409 RepID=A0A5B7CWX2_PORTR|nr:hypothetical protein [Portunus trituberculatus]